jgi:hypothetical protein
MKESFMVSVLKKGDRPHLPERPRRGASHKWGLSPFLGPLEGYSAGRLKVQTWL